MKKQTKVIYINTDERYGGQVAANQEAYEYLNPDAVFETRSDGIYEQTPDGWLMVAEAVVQ
jgi:hypothetical protein